MKGKDCLPQHCQFIQEYKERNMSRSSMWSRILSRPSTTGHGSKKTVEIPLNNRMGAVFEGVIAFLKSRRQNQHNDKFTIIMYDNKATTKSN